MNISEGQSRRKPLSKKVLFKKAEFPADGDARKSDVPVISWRSACLWTHRGDVYNFPPLVPPNDERSFVVDTDAKKVELIVGWHQEKRLKRQENPRSNAGQ